jgi:protein-S-isoprenylcysteine O-methyltransferase Ste14
METERKAVIFTSIAVIASLFLFITGPLFVIQNLTFVMVQIFGALLIIWAIIAKAVNKHEHKHKLPKGYFFITKGPYEILRHPIYAGFLLIMSSIVQYEFTPLRIVVFFILIGMIVLKVIREEYTMEHEIKEYSEYKAKTKRLIPFLF